MRCDFPIFNEHNVIFEIWFHYTSCWWWAFLLNFLQCSDLHYCLNLSVHFLIIVSFLINYLLVWLYYYYCHCSIETAESSAFYNSYCQNSELEIGFHLLLFKNGVIFESEERIVVNRIEEARGKGIVWNKVFLQSVVLYYWNLIARFLCIFSLYKIQVKSMIPKQTSTGKGLFLPTFTPFCFNTFEVCMLWSYMSEVDGWQIHSMLVRQQCTIWNICIPIMAREKLWILIFALVSWLSLFHDEREVSEGCCSWTLNVWNKLLIT